VVREQFSIGPSPSSRSKRLQYNTLNACEFMYFFYLCTNKHVIFMATFLIIFILKVMGMLFWTEFHSHSIEYF
jgi:hypothetical protein